MSDSDERKKKRPRAAAYDVEMGFGVRTQSSDDGEEKFYFCGINVIDKIQSIFQYIIAWANPVVLRIPAAIAETIPEHIRQHLKEARLDMDGIRKYNLIAKSVQAEYGSSFLAVTVVNMMKTLESEAGITLTDAAFDGDVLTGKEMLALNSAIISLTTKLAGDLILPIGEIKTAKKPKRGESKKKKLASKKMDLAHGEKKRGASASFSG